MHGAAYAVVWCLSVRSSVLTFVFYVEMSSKHILKRFSPIGRITILVFFTIPNVMEIFRPGPPTGPSNAGGVGTNRDSQPIFGYRIDDCWTCDQQLRRSTVHFTAHTATHQ